jgi:hypothetical protein
VNSIQDVECLKPQMVEQWYLPYGMTQGVENTRGLHASIVSSMSRARPSSEDIPKVPSPNPLIKNALTLGSSPL